MKILIAHNFYRSHQQGGEDVVVHHEVAALKERLGAENVFTYFIYNDDIKILPLVTNIWGNRQHAKNIAGLIKQHKIDILHVHNEFPLLTPLVFKAAKINQCKVIQTLHNFRHQCLSGTLYRTQKNCENCVNQSLKWQGILHRCYRGSFIQSLLHALAQKWYQYHNYYSYIDYHFVLTTFQRDKLISFGVKEDKLLLKPNFVKRPLNLVAAQQRKNYLFIGRIEPGKGIEILLKIWVTLPKHYKLKIIGTGPSLASLKERYNQTNIDFMGVLSHEEAMTELKQSKYLVHPSLYYETFGLTILEALSHGVPVIGFPIGTRPAFIADGVNGFLCTENSLSEVLLSSLEYPDYCQMSQKAIESSHSFCEESVIIQQINQYESILKGSPN